jgi:Lipase (class 3)
MVGSKVANRVGMIWVFLVAVGLTVARAQSVLQPGFDAKEYLGLLQIAENGSTDYSLGYRSPEVGMLNRWDLWLRNDRRVAVIAIRGTVGEPLSWLENFYAAMVPAKGVLQLSDSLRFDYQLAADDKAMVHVGWLLGVAYLAPTVVAQIRHARQEGIREFIIFGHSQGGALSFLMRSYLYYLQQDGQLPADIVFKTYCSAAPKPGNTYYAYDFDFITRGGWAFTVVNAADWVPETPFSIQTPDDLNAVNPFANLDRSLKRQSFLVRLYLRGQYHRLRRRTRRAAKAFRKVLGDKVYQRVKKSLPGVREPTYTGANNYQRAGVPIVLEPDSAYYRRFAAPPEKIFQHHQLAAYEWLINKYYQ